ncbi:MAG: Rid family hydrolase [Armatimonadota bacterium]
MSQEVNIKIPCLGSDDLVEKQSVGGLSFSDHPSSMDPNLMPLRPNGSAPGCDGGAQSFTQSGAQLHPIKLNGRRQGCWVETPTARVAWLWSVCGDLAAPRGLQTQQLFENAELALQQAGMSWRDVVRTWFYLDDLLEWYDEFNAIRTEYFVDHGVLDGLVPASTGIGLGNHLGRACVAGILAVVPKENSVRIRAVESPLQNSALHYRSSFSRAVEIETATERQLMISGTASIDPQGLSAHQDDPQKQIELTMQVVKAILTSRGMDWCHTTRAIAYCKRPEYAELFRRYCAINQVPLGHCLFVQADICREELLFELELDAKVRP